MKRTTQVTLITVAAVITASPRWIGSLLASEGFTIPQGWTGWWVPISALAAFCMAAVESWAFAFIFDAWRREKDWRLLTLAIAAAGVFVVVLSPFVVAQAKDSAVLSSVLSNDIMLWFWGTAVASSTIVIVAGVGYAQKESEGVSMANYRHLQQVATQRAQELEALEGQLGGFEEIKSELKAMRDWRETLQGFDVTTKQGAAALITFALNGGGPTQKILAGSLDASEGTVRLGQAQAKEAGVDKGYF